jgi:hypothetical protein
MPGFETRLVFVALAMRGLGDVSLGAGGDRGGEDVPEVEGMKSAPENRFGSVIPGIHALGCDG